MAGCLRSHRLASLFERSKDEWSDAFGYFSAVGSFQKSTQELDLIVRRPRQGRNMTIDQFVGGVKPWRTTWKSLAKP